MLPEPETCAGARRLRRCSGAGAGLAALLLLGLGAARAAGLWTTGGPAAVGITCVRHDPTDPNRAYALGSPQGIFRSTDAGAHWASITSGLGTPSAAILAVDPVNAGTLYLGKFGAVYKSTNAGGSWNFMGEGLTLFGVVCLWVDPAVPSRIYAGLFGDGVFRTTDAGASWQRSTTLISSYASALVGDPSAPGTVYYASSSGMHKTTNAGASWTQVGSPPASVRAIVVDQGPPSVLYAATPLGVYRSTDGGASWTSTSVDDARSLALLPGTPATLYAGLPGGVVKRSSDGGASWVSIGAGLPAFEVASLDVDDKGLTTLYAGLLSGGGVWQSSPPAPVELQRLRIE